MKRLLKAAIYSVITLSAIGCAKTVSVGVNDANKRFFEAWLHTNNITTEPQGRGIYIIEDVPGTGKEVKRDGFVYLDYTTMDLEGNILDYTSEDIAKKLGEYSKSAYYGPRMITNFTGSTYAGVLDMLDGMKTGGKRKVIIPGWLMSYSDFKTEEEYLAQTTSQSSTIYEICVRDYTDSAVTWEIDSIGRFFSNEKLLIAGKPVNQLFLTEKGTPMTVSDSIKNGFYYSRIKAPVTDSTFSSDTTIYINYTGMTLNGQVFDTTYEDVAKDYNIYSPSREYKPVQIKWPSTKNEEGEAEDYTSITMGSEGSSVISGFALTLWQMKAMEQGIGLFYSPLGYSYNGSGESIPSYSPLIFKIEIVEKPE